MNHSSAPNHRRTLFGRANTRRNQPRIPTAFGGGASPPPRPSHMEVTNSIPRHEANSHRGDAVSAFERCEPRGPLLRDPLAVQATNTSSRGGDSLHGVSCGSSISSRGSYNNSNHNHSNEEHFHKDFVEVVEEDCSQSSSRRGRVNKRYDECHYYQQDAMFEPMPSPVRKQPNLRGTMNCAIDAASLLNEERSNNSHSRKRTGHVYEQEESIIEPMSPVKLPPLKAPPSRMDSYEEALARKMASFEKPAAKKEAPVLKSPPVQQPLPSSPDHWIEIAPGCSARLRGAQETFDCIANDFYMPTTCFCCSTNLFCIMDAEYVLCPVCKVVSPVGESNNATDGGVGLGFTFEDLQHYQNEILRGRSVS